MLSKAPKAADRKWPAEKVERRPVDKLKPYANNARTHSPEQIAQLVESIREWGWTQPILIDGRNEIIAGHGRLEAAKSLGVKEVPVIVARGWTAEQKRAYALADNQLALNAEWDMDLLAIELGELQIGKFSTDIIGFSADALEKVFGSGRDFAPTLNPETDSRLVTPEDIEKAGERLDNKFVDSGKQTIVDVSCPHCGEILSINKDAL